MALVNNASPDQRSNDAPADQGVHCCHSSSRLSTHQQVVKVKYGKELRGKINLNFLLLIGKINFIQNFNNGVCFCSQKLVRTENRAHKI